MSRLHSSAEIHRSRNLVRCSAVRDSLPKIENLLASNVSSPMGWSLYKYVLDLIDELLENTQRSVREEDRDEFAKQQVEQIYQKAVEDLCSICHKP